MISISRSALLAVCFCTVVWAAEPGTLPGTALLTWKDDIASRMVDGVDRFLLREIDKSVAGRERYWKRDFSSREAYEKSVAANRKMLAQILGVRDERVAFTAPELVASTARPALLARAEKYEIHAIRWPVFGEVHGEGLLLAPVGAAPVANVIALPDADQTPEQLAGLAEGTAAESQYARRLAEAGCRVVVPTLIERRMEKRNGRANLTSREFLYRPAFELGRHIIGYEIQKTLAVVDWYAKESPQTKIGVIGWGEGGLVALYSAALDTRIAAACVSGHFDDRRGVWQQPIDRNVFGLLERFGDAEVASLVAPRALIIEAAKGPELTLPSQGGAPGRLVTPRIEDVRAEVERARAMTEELRRTRRLELVVSDGGNGPCGSKEALRAFLECVSGGAGLAAGAREQSVVRTDPAARQVRQMGEIDRENQRILAESAEVRKKFMAKLDTSSPEKYEKSAAEYRRFFYDEVIGRFEKAPLPPNPRTREAYNTEKFVGYEVVLDVFEDVFAYGILLVPKDIKSGERRPVVVCQHGLEGRPQQVVSGNSPSYHDFAARLAERGFVTFAPQNPYIFGDRFRGLQRKANPIKKTLFSIITPQHQQIINWLKAQPFVDGRRIAFYGLSYGGKTAMRVPALLTDYCMSICSADFNEWVWKNASTSSPYSYVWTNEYEIFEFDLGSTFNYAEMAALIAPRPFMVERGHFDGVSSDEAVAYEFAKVRFLYEARLKLEDRCAIEWFVGPHTINGKGTFEFLHRHLEWAKP